MWQALKNIIKSIIDPKFCPNCEQSQRVSWRDGMWACPGCDLTPSSMLTFPDYPRRPTKDAVFCQKD